MKEMYPIWNDIHALISSMVEAQKDQLLAQGRKIVPTLTPEDMLQPNDYIKLDNDPNFRYEEGTLAGMQTMQMALRAFMKDIEAHNATTKDAYEG